METPTQEMVADASQEKVNAEPMTGTATMEPNMQAPAAEMEQDAQEMEDDEDQDDKQAMHDKEDADEEEDEDEEGEEDADDAK